MTCVLCVGRGSYCLLLTALSQQRGLTDYPAIICILLALNFARNLPLKGAWLNNWTVGCCWWCWSHVRHQARPCRGLSRTMGSWGIQIFWWWSFIHLNGFLFFFFLAKSGHPKGHTNTVASLWAIPPFLSYCMGKYPHCPLVSLSVRRYLIILMTPQTPLEMTIVAWYSSVYSSLI